jgi:hypothetical protein
MPNTPSYRAPGNRFACCAPQIGLKTDLCCFEMFAGAPQLAIETAERRAAIARDETGRVQARKPIAIALREEQTHERLQAGDEQWARLVEPVPLVQPCDLL